MTRRGLPRPTMADAEKVEKLLSSDPTPPPAEGLSPRAVQEGLKALEQARALMDCEFKLRTWARYKDEPLRIAFGSQVTVTLELVPHITLDREVVYGLIAQELTRLEGVVRGAGLRYAPDELERTEDY